MRTALIIGASGLVGSYLLNFLLEDDQYEKVISLVRKTSALHHAKLQEEVCDFSNLDQYTHLFEGIRELYICIGTTQKKTPDKNAYYAIDYGIPTTAATIAVRMHVHTVAVISAMGANAQSRIFYNATKGKMEAYLKRLHIPHLVIVRPSLLTGPRKENRRGEQAAKMLFQALHFLIPKKYRAIQAEDVAKAMLILSQGTNLKTTWENDELLKLTQSKS